MHKKTDADLCGFVFDVEASGEPLSPIMRQALREYIQKHEGRLYAELGAQTDQRLLAEILSHTSQLADLMGMVSSLLSFAQGGTLYVEYDDGSHEPLDAELLSNMQDTMLRQGRGDYHGGDDD